MPYDDEPPTPQQQNTTPAADRWLMVVAAFLIASGLGMLGFAAFD